MTRLWHSTFGLLLVTGILLGATPPFGKLATAAGIPALLWALVISGGVGGVLVLVLAVRKIRPALTVRVVRYALIAGAISFAIPNVLMFAVVPHLGAGYTGIMFTLSPVITLGLSILFGVRRPNALGIAGIAVGFAGAATVALTRGEAGQPAEAGWVLLGLLIPVFLASGNIYRTVDWPTEAGSVELAAGSHLASAALLLSALIATGDMEAAELLAGSPLLVLGQVATASAMFAFFFRLQAVGGPVYLSQIGYVGAAVGLLIGVAVLGERYAPLTWIGAAVITVGVLMTTRAQGRASTAAAGTPAPAGR
ncbi:DMT family transporter [Chthonobacter albigriseus]|uniref:DMT family transporter n=1 Tax=Chthonobacter albigriseus TaxID=1683161 RepID=UPI0015EFDAD8|nr:DMT family transporter [Chthonobacter albigriseus]